MAKKKCPECECPICLPRWLGTFGDLMSLLLCFFVLLLSMSTMDTKKISEAIGSLNGAMSVLEGGTKTEVSKERMMLATPLSTNEETADAVNRIAATVIEANELVQQGGGPTITVEEAEEGFMVNLPAKLLFKAGSATIANDDALLFLKRVALIVSQFPTDIEISVRGHTDNTPPARGSVFKDNWDLSAGRAITVLKELIKNGVSPKRSHASGFGEFRPIASNLTAEGRGKNRRVEIRFIGRKKENNDKAKQSILESDLGKDLGVKDLEVKDF
jgi:chemotaxis protein MotB